MSRYRFLAIIAWTALVIAFSIGFWLWLNVTPGCPLLSIPCDPAAELNRVRNEVAREAVIVWAAGVLVMALYWRFSAKPSPGQDVDEQDAPAETGLP